MQVISESAPERPRSMVPRQDWLLWAGATALTGAVLMFCYLRVAGVTGVNSDAAGIILQASDVLHGNLLLRGWVDTDVSFYTTELPEYIAVTAVAGVRPEVVHVCAALTYTLLVVLAALVGRGRARGAEGVVRALLAGGVMLAPQAGSPAETWVLLGSPDHIGTTVPLLLLLILLDRPEPRWYVPAGAGVLLAWSIIGDPLVEVIGVIPLVLACLLRAGRMIAARRAADQREPGIWRAISYEVSIAAAAVTAVPVASLAYGVIRHFGGYQLGPPLYGQVSRQMVEHNAPWIWRSVLSLFGANYAGAKGTWNVAAALLHLAGVGIVIAGVALAVWLLVRPARATRLGDLIADVLLLAILANMAACLLLVPLTNMWAAHEIAPVLPLSAALAARVLGGPLLRFRPRGKPLLVPVLAAGLVCYAILLGGAFTAPQGAPQYVGLAAWLRNHHLIHGMSNYWLAASTVVDNGGRTTMLSVSIHGGRIRLLAPDSWEQNLELAKPATHTANFYIVQLAELVMAAKQKLALEMFGKPACVYHFESYTIMVWNKNLLGNLAGPPVP